MFMERKFFKLTYGNLCSDGTFIAMCVQSITQETQFYQFLRNGNVQLLLDFLSKVRLNSAHSSKWTALGDLKLLTPVIIIGSRKIIVVPKNPFPSHSAKVATVIGYGLYHFVHYFR